MTLPYSYKGLESLMAMAAVIKVIMIGLMCGLTCCFTAEISHSEKNVKKVKFSSLQDVMLCL